MSTIPPPTTGPPHVIEPTISRGQPATDATVALLGNPNAGKTTLFNRLTGLRAKTANFPGTTLEIRRGAADLENHRVTLLDLPGLYGLTDGNPEEIIAAQTLRGQSPGINPPAAAILVIDATRIARHLYLVSQVRETNVPVIIALNMIDAADREGLRIDIDALSQQLAAPAIPISARTGRGLVELRRAIESLLTSDANAPSPPPESLAACSHCSGCPHAARHTWASDVAACSVKSRGPAAQRWADHLDRLLTHPIAGLAVFASIMAGLFILIFSTAAVPMDLIDAGMSRLCAAIATWLPPGDLQSFIVDGIIGGVGGVLVFLPQICILFFILTLLEDTGYLARAALVMDRMMSKVGLPGKAFVPMLSAHACAIPAIMATRVIENRRDRLVSILVIPLLTCSARLPVYAMVTALLFANQPIIGGLVFFGAYALGIVIALIVAFLLKHTLLPGKARPLVIELPDFRLPSLRVALLTTLDRGRIFIKKAGTVILLISICLWVLSTYPKLDETRLPQIATTADIQQLDELDRKIAHVTQTPGFEDALASLKQQRSLVVGKYKMAHSLSGRTGQLLEPVFAPLGFDWHINVGVLSSFAAREVIISTLAIVYGLSEDQAQEPLTLSQTLATQTHPDGRPVYTLATSLSLLVFFVLAMQCLPTQAITKRETGGWKWPLFQIAYMSVLAYTAALLTYQLTSALT